MDVSQSPQLSTSVFQSGVFQSHYFTSSIGSHISTLHPSWALDLIVRVPNISTYCKFSLCQSLSVFRGVLSIYIYWYFCLGGGREHHITAWDGRRAWSDKYSIWRYLTKLFFWSHVSYCPEWYQGSSDPELFGWSVDSVSIDYDPLWSTVADTWVEASSGQLPCFHLLLPSKPFLKSLIC